jgi:hypothetical protein
VRFLTDLLINCLFGSLLVCLHKGYKAPLRRQPFQTVKCRIRRVQGLLASGHGCAQLRRLLQSSPSSRYFPIQRCLAIFQRRGIVRPQTLVRRPSPFLPNPDRSKPRVRKTKLTGDDPCERRFWLIIEPIARWLAAGFKSIDEALCMISSLDANYICLTIKTLHMRAPAEYTPLQRLKGNKDTEHGFACNCA